MWQVLQWNRCLNISLVQSAFPFQHDLRKCILEKQEFLATQKSFPFRFAALRSLHPYLFPSPSAVQGWNMCAVGIFQGEKLKDFSLPPFVVASKSARGEKIFFFERGILESSDVATSKDEGMLFVWWWWWAPDGL